MDAYTQAYNSSGQMVQAFGVITVNGQVLWQSNNWDLTADALELAQAVAKGATAVTQNQIKYTTIRTTSDSLVARNVAGNGTLVLARIDADKFVVAWAAAEGAPDGIYIDVDRAARTLKGKI